MPTKATSIGARPSPRPTSVGDAGSVVLAVEQVIAGHPGLANQPIEQVFAEARGMIDGQTDVFVEMEHLDAQPVDAGCRGERLEKVELRGARRRDDSRAALARDRGAQRLRGVPRRGEAHRRPIGVGFDLHDSHRQFVDSSDVGAGPMCPPRADTRVGPYLMGMAANVFSIFSRTASVDRTPACK